MRLFRNENAIGTQLDTLRRLAASRRGTSAALVGLAFATLAFPFAAPATLALAAMLVRNRTRSYPFRAPIGTRSDPGDINLATGKPGPGKGLMLLGRDDGGRQALLGIDDMKQHVLLLGTTGSGRSEALLGIAANSLAMGSGFLYIDAKGDVGIFARVSALCHEFGRTKDLLLLNFTNQSSGESNFRLSHRINPFAKGGAESLAYMLLKLMPDDASTEGGLRAGRAAVLLSSLLGGLCHLRDEFGCALHMGTIAENLSFPALFSLATDRRLPEAVRTRIANYLSGLPGYRNDRGGDQSQATIERHNDLAFSFSQILETIRRSYSHIFADDGGVDIDMDDVSHNRKILVVLLPVLEKENYEWGVLGKIVIASIAAAMSSRTASDLDADWCVVPTYDHSHRPPFVVIFDCIEHVAIEGMAFMSAIGRGFGFSMVYASSDVESMRSRNRREADRIIANTNTKIFMRSATSGLDRNAALFDLSTEQANRIRIQNAGEAVVMHGGVIANISMAYVPARWDGGPSRKSKRILRVPQLLSPVWSANASEADILPGAAT